MAQISMASFGLRAFNANGYPVSGALCYVYEAGTTTPATTYADKDLTTPQTFPVEANANGGFPEIYVEDGLYKVDITDDGNASLPGFPKDNLPFGFSPVVVLSYATRAAAVVAIASGALNLTANGTTIEAAGLRYIRQTGATMISDMPNYVPVAPYTPGHFGAVGNGSTSDGAAVKAAAATGADILFPKGETFLMNAATVICATDGQKFYGGGRLLKTSGVFDPDDVDQGNDDKAKFFRVNGVNGVEISGLAFQYTLAAESPRVYGVTVENATRTKVLNNKFLGNETPCFLWTGADSTDFNFNYSRGGVFGIAMGYNAVTQPDPITNTRVIGNVIIDCLGDSIDPNWNCQGMLIKDNILLGNGIASAEEDIDIGGGESFDIVVEGNLIDSGGLQKRGITVKLDTRNVVVRDNMIRNTKTDEGDSALIYLNGATVAARARGILIAGNYGAGARHGVYCLNAPTDVKIVENDFDVTHYGVRQVNAHPTLGDAENYNISRNKLRNSAGTLAGSGIDLSFVDGITISENEVDGAAGIGVLLNSNCAEATISGNDITLCSTGINCLAVRSIIDGNKVTACTSHGININADYINVRGNQTWDNSTGGSGARGILLTAGADFCVISGNQSWDTRGTKLQIGLGVTGACDRCIITGNMLYDNSTNLAGTGSLTNSVVADNIAT